MPPRMSYSPFRAVSGGLSELSTSWDVPIHTLLLSMSLFHQQFCPADTFTKCIGIIIIIIISSSSSSGGGSFAYKRL